MKLSPADFFEQFGPDAVSACMGTPYLPSVLLAQAALESGWNESTLSDTDNNFFGIKAGSKWTGDTATYPTPKDPDKISTFRSYASPKECFIDRNKLLDTPTYAAVGMATSPTGQADALGNSPWSGDYSYAADIMGIVQKHNLTTFDEKKK